MRLVGVSAARGDARPFSAPAVRSELKGPPEAADASELLGRDSEVSLEVPIELTGRDADAPRDLTWSIVGLAARKLSTGGYELVYVTDQRQ